MKKGRLKKLKIVLHPLFLVLGVLMVFVGRGRAFFICTLSAFCHEWAHAIIAEKYGYKMERIRLMPFGAELHGDTDSFAGKDEIYVAVAGPLMNLFVCFLIVAGWWIFPEIYGATIDIFETNLVMGIFNLLPFFPLDGGRVLLSLLSLKTNRRDGAKIVKNITKIFSLTLFAGFLLTCFFEINLTLGVMSFLLFFSASTSARDAVYERLSLGEIVRTKSVRWVTISVPESMRIYELRRLHIKNQIIVFKVMNEYGVENFSFSEIDLERLKFKVDQGKSLIELKKEFEYSKRGVINITNKG